jgi:hypothetical protein
VSPLARIVASLLSATFSIFCQESEWVTRHIEMMETIRKCLRRGEVRFGPALSARGWKMNLRVALHILKFPSLPPRKRSGRRKSRDQTSDQIRPDHHAMVLDQPPLSSILAIRHSTLMGLEAMRSLENYFQPQVAHCHRVTRIKICRAIGCSLPGVLKGCIDFISSYYDEQPAEYLAKRHCSPWGIDLGSALRDIAGSDQLMMRSSLNRRLQGVLEDWDNFFSVSLKQLKLCSTKDVGIERHGLSSKDLWSGDPDLTTS